MLTIRFARLAGGRPSLTAALGTATIIALAIALTCARAANIPQQVATNRGVTHSRATLRERLIYGLQARIPSEVEFVDLVVVKVHTGKLPERMVNQTFFWARDRASVARNGSQQRPIIFFMPAMQARAARLDVDLPYTML